MTEKQVKDAVEVYFNKLLPSTEYSIRREYHIPIGSRRGLADLVLWCGFPQQQLVIIECKRSKYKGEEGIARSGGIEQLQSYLCATDTQFGIFAKNDDPQLWDYYENLGQNIFKTIPRMEFEMRIRKKDFGIRRRQERIIERVNEQVDQEVKNCVTQLDELNSKVRSQIQEIGDLREKIGDLRKQSNTHFGWAFVGWSLVIVIILAIIF